MKTSAIFVLACSLSVFSVEKPKPASVASQSAVENLDLAMIARIREEGINHSHIMEYASGLFDGVGQRLTGSPIRQ